MKTTLLSTILVLIAAAAAWAEDHNYGTPCHNDGRHYGRLVYPRYWGGYHHASTYEEGLLRGAADVIRAQGEFNYNTAVAANYAQEALKKKIENKKFHQETFFQMREINRQARYPQESTAEAQARRQRIAASARPDRLGPTEYRADLGLLNWPAPLQREAFADSRQAVDQLVADGPNALVGQESTVKQLTDEMRAELTEQLRAKQVTSHEFAVARKFLTSLKYEAQQATRGTAMAAR